MRYDAKTFKELLTAIQTSGRSPHILSQKAVAALEVGESVYSGVCYPSNGQEDRILRHHSYMMVAKNTTDPDSKKRYVTLVGVTRGGYPEFYTAYLDDLFPDGNSFFIGIHNSPKGKPLTLEQLKKNGWTTSLGTCT